MKAYTMTKRSLLCILLMVCFLLVGCNQSGTYISREMTNDLKRFYEKYLEVTEMFEPLSNIEPQKLEAERQNVIEALNTENSIKKQEELKAIVNDLLNKVKLEHEKEFAESVAHNYKTIVEIKEDTIELDFVDVYIVVNTVREEAKRHIK